MSIKINRNYEVPYIAGYSKDAKTFYVDRRIPEKLKLKNGREIDPVKFVLVHEITEKALEDDLGFHYEIAHRAATQAEKLVCEAHDIDWDEYQDFWHKWAKVTENKFDSIPPDLDFRPYRDCHDTGTIKKMDSILEKVHSKYKVVTK